MRGSCQLKTTPVSSSLGTHNPATLTREASGPLRKNTEPWLRKPHSHRRRPGLRAAVQAQAGWGAAEGSRSWDGLSSPTGRLGVRGARRYPRPRTLPAPRWSQGGPNYAKLGHGVRRARTLGARPGPRVRVARAPVVRLQRKQTGLSLPRAPATRRRASGRFVSPRRSGSARALARSGAASAGGGARAREPRPLATPGGHAQRCRPTRVPAAPGPAQAGRMCSSTSLLQD